jgi:endo-1,4-beta-xylanase
MKKTFARIWTLPALANLFLNGVVGCGEAAPGGPSGDVPRFEGEAPAPADNAMPASSEAEMAATPPSGMQVDSTQEGEVGGIQLQPVAPGGDGAKGEPEGMGTTPPESMTPPENVPPPVFGPPPKFVGNITTGNSLDTNGFVFSDYWDQVTPENAGKWGSVQRTAGGAFNWAALDAIYDYTEQKGIIFKEHTFIWGNQQPTGDVTQADVENWMKEFCTRYPHTRLIDVVNEPPPHTEPSYSNAIGGGTNGNWQWIVNAFTWAHEYCPNATLILNDFNNIEIGNQNQHFIDIVKTIQAAGAPINALGAQAHGLSGGNSTPNMISLLTKLHDSTGLPVYITEYDIDQNDDAAQRDRVQQHFAFFMDTEWVAGVTVWGWIFGRTWVPSSGLIRNGVPRPAMVWLMDELGRPVPQQ